MNFLSSTFLASWAGAIIFPPCHMRLESPPAPSIAINKPCDFCEVRAAIASPQDLLGLKPKDLFSTLKCGSQIACNTILMASWTTRSMKGRMVIGRFFFEPDLSSQILLLEPQGYNPFKIRNEAMSKSARQRPARRGDTSSYIQGISVSHYMFPIICFQCVGVRAEPFSLGHSATVTFNPFIG